MVSCHQVLVRPCTWQLLVLHLRLGHVVVARIEVFLLEEGEVFGLLGVQEQQNHKGSFRECWDCSKPGHENITQGGNPSSDFSLVEKALGHQPVTQPSPGWQLLCLTQGTPDTLTPAWDLWLAGTSLDLLSPWNAEGQSPQDPLDWDDEPG